ncbi:MAG: phage tail tape measure protein [Candidatus Kapabacteria bacterium]|jgi:hypothetical protein|nr:phage tail tape measure protein [Candidatus Kapabacteria bacterium]
MAKTKLEITFDPKADKLEKVMSKLKADLKAIGMEVPDAFGKFGDEAGKSGTDAGEEFKRKFEEETDNMPNPLENLPEAPNPMEKWVKMDFALNAANQLKDSVGALNERASATADAFRILKAQTGASAEEMEHMTAAASDLYGKGVGESYAESLKAIGTANQMLGDFVTDGEKGLSDFTVTAAGIAKVFDRNIEDVIAGSRTMIAQFKLEGQEAGDIVAMLSQTSGGKMDDVLDSLDEYSQHAAAAGYSAQGFAATLSLGMSKGIRDTDKLGDVIKETIIRLNQGDTANALSKIDSSITAQVQGITQLGEAGVLSIKEVLQQTAKLTGDAVKDGKITEAVRDQFNTAISGTMGEDIGGRFYSEIFSAKLDIAQLTARAREAGDAMADAIEPKSMVDKLSRSIGAGMDTAAASFAPVISAANTTLGAVSGVAPAFMMFQSFSGPVKNAAMAIKTKLIPSIMAQIKSTKGATTVQKLLNLAMKMSPWGLAIAGVVALGVAFYSASKSQAELLAGQKTALVADKKLIVAQKELNLATQDNEIGTLRLIDQYEALGGQATRTTAEEQQLVKIKEELNSAYPGVISKTKTFDQTLLDLSKKAGLSRDKLAELRGEFDALSDKEFKVNTDIAENNFDTLRNKLKDLASGSSAVLSVSYDKALDELTKKIDTGKTKEEIQAATVDLQQFINKLHKESKASKLWDLSTVNKVDADEYKEMLDVTGQLSAGTIAQLDAVEANEARLADTRSESYKEYESKIKKVVEVMDTLSKPKYVQNLETLKGQFDKLLDVELNMKDGERGKMEALYTNALNSYKKFKNDEGEVDEKAAALREKASAAREKAAADYERFIERSNATQLKNTQALESAKLNVAIKGLEARKAGIESEAGLESSRIASLIDLNDQLLAIRLKSVNVNLSDGSTASMTDALATRMNNEIAAETKKYEAFKDLAGLGKTQKINAEKEFAETLAAIQAKYLQSNADKVSALTEKHAKEDAALRAKLGEAAERERIMQIESRVERERELAISEARATYEEDLALAGTNEDMKLDAYLRFISAKKAADDQYHSESASASISALKSLTASMTSTFSSMEMPEGADRSASIRENIAAIKEEEDELKASYRRGEVDRTEYLTRLNQLDREREREIKKLGASASAVLDHLNAGLAASFAQASESATAAMLKNRDLHLTLLDAAAEKEREIGEQKLLYAQQMEQGRYAAALETAENIKALNDDQNKITKKATDISARMYGQMAVSIGASMGTAMASGKSMLKAMVVSALSALQAMVPVFSAQILGGSLATPQSVMTAGGAGFAQWALMTAGLTAVVAAASVAVSSMKFFKGTSRVVGLGTRTSDGVSAQLSRDEAVWNADAADAGDNRTMVEWTNTHRRDARDYYRTDPRMMSMIVDDYKRNGGGMNTTVSYQVQQDNKVLKEQNNHLKELVNQQTEQNELMREFIDQPKAVNKKDVMELVKAEIGRYV